MPRSNETILLPTISYVLSKDVKLVFLGIIQDLKIATKYVGQLAKKVTLNGELKGLKFHDHHVLMQQLLPLCIQTLLAKDVQMVITRICWVFGRICAKSVDPSTIPKLLEETTLTMCLFKKVYLPFFDIMTHLPIHLVQQLDICGPVHTKWMYPMEHYLKTLKGYILQQA